MNHLDEDIRLLRLDIAELFKRQRGEPGERGPCGERGPIGITGRDGLEDVFSYARIVVTTG